MKDNELFELLKGDSKREEDWVDGASQFIKLKTASLNKEALSSELLNRAAMSQKELNDIKLNEAFTMVNKGGIGGDFPKHIKSTIRGHERELHFRNAIAKKNRNRISGLETDIANKIKDLHIIESQLKGGDLFSKIIKHPATKAIGAGTALVGAGLGIRHLLRKKKLEKQAQEEGIPIHEVEQIGEGPDIPAIQEFMQSQQQANEAEFFRQLAEEASARADQFKEQAEEAQQQVMQIQQESQSKDMMADQASQQAAVSQQDAMMARDESLGAQQQNIAVRQAVTSYRQQLMDLLSQDPVQSAGPPEVPQGPMTGPSIVNPGSEAAPPMEMGMGMPPTPQMQEPPPPPQSPMSPPGVTVNVKPPGKPNNSPKPEVPEAPAQPAQ